MLQFWLSILGAHLDQVLGLSQLTLILQQMKMVEFDRLHKDLLVDLVTCLSLTDSDLLTRMP